MPVVSAQPFLFTLLSPFPSLALSAEGEWAVQDLNGNSQGLVNKKLTESNESQEVQNPVHILEKHPELADLIARWPDLPETVKQSIIDTVRNGRADTCRD